MPFCNVTLRAPRPLPAAYPRELKTIGDHIRKRRLDLGLLQKDVALRLGVNKDSVTNWEKNRFGPRLYLIPRIIEFLGYVPLSGEGKDVLDRIVELRRILGIRQDELAHQLGVDPSTLARWEQGKGYPSASHARLLADMLSVLQPRNGA